MPKYAVLFEVSKRMKDSFTNEELETAARVFFYMHPPEECRINTPSSELKVSWSQEYFGMERWAIRIVGDVNSPEHN